MLTTWGNHLKEFGKKFQATIMKLAKRMLSMHELVISIRGSCARNWKFHFSTTLSDFLPISKCFMFWFWCHHCFPVGKTKESLCQNLSLECPCMVQNRWIVKVRIKCLRAHWPLKSDSITQEELVWRDVWVHFISTLNSQHSSTTLCNRTNKGGSYFLRQKRNESMDLHRHERNRGFCDI